MRPRVALTINTGSSSVKAAVFDVSENQREPSRLAAVDISRIGQSEPRISASGIEGDDRARVRVTTLTGAIAVALDMLGRARSSDVIVHRIVHGGGRHGPELVSQAALNEIQRFVDIDPDHLPQALAAIDLAGRRFPGVPQVLCYDTAFHASMPPPASTYAVPRRYRDAGLRRYGFHGLSCEWSLRVLQRVDPIAAAGRVIVAHLGSGASVTAIYNGRSVDTTMGYSPAGGIVMSTRSGDLDPGALMAMLARTPGGADELARILNTASGLTALSEGTGDMEALLAREGDDRAAALAVDVFCHAVRRAIGAHVATLGGLDAVVFTGGIGEHAAAIRQRVCDRLTVLGLSIDTARNFAQADVISSESAPVIIRIIAADEACMLALHARDLMTEDV